MNINSTNKLFTLIVFSTFAVQHSLLFSIGCIIYFVLNNISQQELESIMNLRNYILNGDKWIKQLHEEAKKAKNADVPLNTPRNIFTGLWEQLKDRFTPEQIESFKNNKPLTDKLVDVLEEETKEEIIEWECWSLQDLVEDDCIDSVVIEFIQKAFPDVNITNPFTLKDYRLTIKKLKAFCRNPDGSIKYSKFNDAIEYIIFVLNTYFHTSIDLPLTSQEIVDYVFNEEWKSI